jgi:alpha-L-fucosidase
VHPSINPQTDWKKKNQKGWIKQDEVASREVSHVSKPIQQEYVLQEITAGKDQDQLVEISSGDGLQVWLNGENLVLHNNPRGSRMNRELVLLPLKTGRNQLLIRFYNRYGYLMEYGINKDIPQMIYRQKLQPLELKGLTECELGLQSPESPHRTIRLNNIRIEL